MGNRHKKKPCYLALCFVRNHKANSIKLPLDNEYVIVKKGEETIHFVCLTQKALINSNIPSNTVTKLRLKELEDVLIGFYSEYNLQEDKRLTDYSATTTEADTLFNSSRHS